MNLYQFMLQNHTEVLELTLEHLWLVGVSTVLAVLIGIPLGILITRWPALNKPVLGGANIIQTIPSLALFGFLLPAPWIGARADRLAILALALYALLPLIRNTYTGIKGVDPAIVEAGRGMGMTDRQLLFQVELPLALGVIIAGVRVATVISVGLATIAAAIGAGGFGEYIFRGLAMVNNSVILAGAIPAAVMALLADVSLGWLEKRLSPLRFVILSESEELRTEFSEGCPIRMTIRPLHENDLLAVRSALIATPNLLRPLAPESASWSAPRTSPNSSSSEKSSPSKSKPKPTFRSSAASIWPALTSASRPSSPAASISIPNTPAPH